MLRYLKPLYDLARDVLIIPQPEEILQGNKLFRPFFSYQKQWLHYCYPTDEFNNQSAWFYLTKYMIPLIAKHGSSYHIVGIEKLKLNNSDPIPFEEFQELFYKTSNGFSVIPVDDEITPREYFRLIANKKFPCVKRLRDSDEIFCANEPDFWHDAVGHITPLCFPEIQDFYLSIAQYVLSAKDDIVFNNHVAIAWTIMEYGFLKENNENKMFGAALVGSHLAHMRYLKGLINIEHARRQAILESGFYDEDSIAKDQTGRFRFFCLNDLRVDYLFYSF